MIFWYWYLFAAAALSFSGYIILDIFLTAALAVIVHLPVPPVFSKPRLITGLKAVAVPVAALALLWRESYLPPVSKLVSFLADPVTRPSMQYVMEFVRQSISLWMLSAGIVLFAITLLASRKKYVLLAMSAYCILTAAWVMQPKRTIPDLGSESPEAFYKKESGRVVEFSPPAKNSPPFDVLILHICSLSWEDIKDSGSDLMPFLSKFDYVFTNFSAACSYSGPAALRVLRSSCGQMPHPQLYAAAPASCYLMDNLRELGFKTYTMFSHDGVYADFSAGVQKYGHADAPLGIAGLPVEYQMFDGTPLYADNAALHKFWKAREDSKAPRAALYYNTANLHIGTHKAGGSRGPDDAASYRQRLTEMTAQLEEFFLEVERSGRNAVVIFVPEHGAALSGTKMQAKDVREIPLPSIVVLPFAVKLIGKSFYADTVKPQVITKPASLQALSWLVAEFLRHNPYTKDAGKPAAIASEIPGTDFMAENENAAVMRLGLGYIYKQKDGKWSPLPAYAGIPPGAIPSPQDFRQAARR
ncbi:MAG: cellulose biosynthesis protein BcsG [Elusimicrobia bacterium]|nr:cellulose biosynthesis protein BcsG [Elusimicrobiota bacterium]